MFLCIFYYVLFNLKIANKFTKVPCQCLLWHNMQHATATDINNCFFFNFYIFCSMFCTLGIEPQLQDRICSHYLTRRGCKQQLCVLLQRLDAATRHNCAGIYCRCALLISLLMFRVCIERYIRYCNWAHNLKKWP